MRREFLLAAAMIASPAGAAENVMLVLDASGSMWGQIEGKTKVEIARGAIEFITRDWNAANQLGLVAYGHRVKGECKDIETLIPVGPLDRARFLATVNGLGAKGMTPLSAAVIQAAEALKFSEQKATVILVSDGEETCELDPCAVGRDLEARGVAFTAHVIGFDVADPNHQQQLRCLAENTGGRYLDARDAGELAQALTTAVSATTAPPAPAPAAVSLEVADSAMAGTTVSVVSQGPVEEGNWFGFAPKGAPWSTYRDYRYQSSARVEDTLRVPGEPGEYELRFVRQSASAVLATRPFRVTPAQASIEAPSEAMAGDTIEVTAQGPSAEAHWIGFAPRGSSVATYRDYERPTGASSVLRLTAPTQEGDYELRYVLWESEAIAFARPIRILPPVASIEAPDSVVAGATITVTASGPLGDGHWVGFAPKGSPISAYGDYERLPGRPVTVELTAPDAPGEYELRYVLNESERIAASRPIRVTPGG